MTETAQAEQTPASEAPASKPTLEDLYDQYDVGSQPQPAPQAAPPAAEPTPEQTQPGTDDLAAIRTELAQLRAAREADNVAALQREEEADLNRAVAILSEASGVKGKDAIAKGFLIAKASEDQRLRVIFQARKEKPKAWRQAVEILADEFHQQFAVSNPQLEENQRAMEESQRAQSSQAPPAKKPEDEVMGKNDADFAQFWARLAGRSY